MKNRCRKWRSFSKEIVLHCLHSDAVNQKAWNRKRVTHDLFVSSWERDQCSCHWRDKSRQSLTEEDLMTSSMKSHRRHCVLWPVFLISHARHHLQMKLFEGQSSQMSVTPLIVDSSSHWQTSIHYLMSLKSKLSFRWVYDYLPCIITWVATLSSRYIIANTSVYVVNFLSVFLDVVSTSFETHLASSSKRYLHDCWFEYLSNPVVNYSQSRLMV